MSQIPTSISWEMEILREIVTISESVRAPVVSPVEPTYEIIVSPSTNASFGISIDSLPTRIE